MNEMDDSVSGPFCEHWSSSPESCEKCARDLLKPELDRLRTALDEAAKHANGQAARIAELEYVLRIYCHAHESGNSVAPHFVARARALLEKKP